MSTFKRCIGIVLCVVLGTAVVLLTIIQVHTPGKYFVRMKTMAAQLDQPAYFEENTTSDVGTPKVLCMILTTPSNWNTKGKAVLNTWAKRCHRAIFFYSKVANCSSQPICNHPSAVGLNIPEGRNHLPAKTFGALNYSFSKYAAEADYFLKADDDTYVIMENLHRSIVRFNSTPLLYLGRKFSTLLRNGYNSGGAGYVLSREVVRLLVQNASSKSCQTVVGLEDLEIGKCLEKFGIYPQNELEPERRLIFHDENPLHVFENHQLESTYCYINLDGIEFGNPKAAAEHGSMLSNWTATLHYVSPSEMYMYDFLVYRLTK